MKKKIFLFLIIVLLVESCAFYFYVKWTRKKLKEAEANLKKIELLNKEIEKCHELLSKKAGSFSDYEYCKKLLQTFEEVK